MSEPSSSKNEPKSRRTGRRSGAVNAAWIVGSLGAAGAIIAALIASRAPSVTVNVGSTNSTQGQRSPSHSPGPSPLSSCPSERGSWNEEPQTLPGLSTTSLKFCTVDINNGQPVEDILHLSGVIHGQIPRGYLLALVSWPDPTTCSLSGSSGSGTFYFQTQIKPSGMGYWQWTTKSSGPGNQTIRRFIYFVLVPDGALSQLESASISLPGSARELAYVKVQGVIPPGHHC
jgi:hypothetical protein